MITEEGPSNSLQRRDRRIRYRGETVKFGKGGPTNFFIEEIPSSSLLMSDCQIRYNAEGHNM